MVYAATLALLLVQGPPPPVVQRPKHSSIEPSPEQTPVGADPGADESAAASVDDAAAAPSPPAPSDPTMVETNGAEDASPVATATPRPTTPSAEEMPPPGRAMQAGGGVMVGLAGLATLYGVAFLLPSFVQDGAIAASILAPAAVVGAGGATLLVYGTRRHRRYRNWMTERALEPPRPGHGNLVAGGTGLAVGLSAMIPAVVSVSRSRSTVGAGTGFLIGGAGLAIGSTMLGVGLWRARRYRTWRAGSGYGVAPNVGFGRHGATFGLTIRPM